MAGDDKNKPNFALGSRTHAAPIFIQGILQRSGTNFLRDLLCLHPDCDINGPVWEDNLLSNSDLLIRYAESTYNGWNPDWHVAEKLGSSDLLCKSIGDGLISFLNKQAEIREVQNGNVKQESQENDCPKRLVTKSPKVNNLRHFLKLFPSAQLLIIIRDGRSVVESGVRSFQWDYERKMKEWDQAARKILQFDQEMRSTHPNYMIVRYEDLFTNKEKELRKIFSLTGLDPDKYNFEAATNLPISGSSELLNKGEKEVHWRAVTKSGDFNPLDRWKEWDRDRHERFNWIAGKALTAFGYKKQSYHEDKILWYIRNVYMDMKRITRTLLKRSSRLLIWWNKK